MNYNFYDIESLQNVFTLCNFKEKENILDVFYLSDTPQLTSEPDFEQKCSKVIYDANRNFNGSIKFYDLSTPTAVSYMATTFGVWNSEIINNPQFASDYPDPMRLVCDTDPNYDDDIHPYLMGYNSYNYDTTMLAQFFDSTIQRSKDAQGNPIITLKPITANDMRIFNDDLFLPDFKKNMPSRLTVDPKGRNKFNNAQLWTKENYQDNRWLIRRNMLLSGRHIDVARLNEKQTKVGLKRLLGMLGFQILESEKLKPNTSKLYSPDELYDLIAYNTSDVVNLAKLFHHKLYTGQFTLKKELLKKYPELIYTKKQDTYEPDISPQTVDRQRMRIDSSSAQFVTRALCPYGYLHDIEKVSFMYPSLRKVEELQAKGINAKQINVLEETKNFFFKLFPQPSLRAKFMVIYDYYKSIEGKNFNASSNYFKDYANDEGVLPEELIPHTLNEIAKCDSNIIYYKRDGSPSTCFATFSTGGIHGAEYNKTLFDMDMDAWNQTMLDMAYVKSVYPDPLELRRAKKIVMPDGTERPYKDFLTSKATIKAMESVKPSERAELFYKDFSKSKPLLFKTGNTDSTKINPKYVYTSLDSATHEDFTSYYPGLLRMLNAFWNENLGYDRYEDFYNDKELYGEMMNDESKYTKEERAFYAIMRAGDKLFLNSASGAGDTNFESNIRMNNTIISMRIIGQLFTWRIAQAQTYYGAKITSTNTDGLYSVLEKELNNKILKQEAEEIGVAIKPEPMYLISKDSNNRMELKEDFSKILSASGSSLACRNDTDPTKSLDHPAIIDWALSEYLIKIAKQEENLSITDSLNEKVGMSILLSAKNHFKKPHMLRMFQNIVASSDGTYRYIYTSNIDDPERIHQVQHYNRVFLVKDETPGAVNVHMATAKAITTNTAQKRNRNNEAAVQNEPQALYILQANSVQNMPRGREAQTVKVKGIEETWPCLIENHSINDMDEHELNSVIRNLDYDNYLKLLKDAFDKNWKNEVANVY